MAANARRSTKRAPSSSSACVRRSSHRRFTESLSLRNVSCCSSSCWRSTSMVSMTWLIVSLLLKRVNRSPNKRCTVLVRYMNKQSTAAHPCTWHSVARVRRRPSRTRPACTSDLSRSRSCWRRRHLLPPAPVPALASDGNSPQFGAAAAGCTAAPAPSAAAHAAGGGGGWIESINRLLVVFSEIFRNNK